MERSTRAIEQIEAEKALRESDAHFRELADNISQFAWTADQTGWIYWYNKRWHDYTGTTLKEMEGCSLITALPHSGDSLVAVRRYVPHADP